MKKLLLASAFCSIVTLQLLAQAPSIAWQKALGGTANESAYSIRPTADGGYIVAGSAASNNGDVTGNHGMGDFWVAKLDASGTLVWQKSVGGMADETASAIEEITGGGYIVAGTSSSSDGDFAGANQHGGGGDYAVAKLDATGTPLWAKTFGGAGYDNASAVHQTPDGGFVVAGYSDSQAGDISSPKGGSDFWLVKLTSGGDIAWEKSYGGTIGDYANHFAIATDGGFIVVGSSESTNGDVTGNHGFYDFWVVKLDTGGTLTWQKSFGGSGFDLPYHVANTTDGGYVVTGYSTSSNGDVTGSHGSEDYWVVKITSTGTLDWQKALGGSGADKASSIWQTADGGYFVAGSANSANGDVTGVHSGADDLWVAKLDSAGAIVWEKAMGSLQVDGARAACPVQTGGYMVAGFVNASDGDVTGHHGGADFWVVKLNSSSTDISDLAHDAHLEIFPNPASDKITLRIEHRLVGATYTIIDALGRELRSAKLSQESNEISLDQLPSGYYILQVRGKQVGAIRFIKQ